MVFANLSDPINMVKICNEFCPVRGGYFVLMKEVVNGFKAVVLRCTTS
jgi:hypothetical protein